MTHVTRVKGSYHTCAWVTSHLDVSHVTPMNASCHAYEWVTSHLQMTHVTRMHWQHYIYEEAVSHVRMSHVINKTRCTTNNNQQPCTALPCNQIPGNSLKGQQAPQSLHMINLVARCLLRMSTSLTIKPFHIWMSNITNMITEWAFVTIILFFSVYKRNLRI